MAMGGMEGVAGVDLEEEGVGVGVGVGSARQQVVNLVKEALAATVPDLDGVVTPQVAICGSSRALDGDYQCNNAMGLWSKVRGSGQLFQTSNAVGRTLAENFPPSSGIVERITVSGPGFVNITISDRWIEKKLRQVLVCGVRSWAPHDVVKYKRAVVDFSSPNIAKEMHVGHLRSTVIGDSLCRMLEFCGVEVLRRNHVGDWGTQFGMLIEFLFEQFPDREAIGGLDVRELQRFYKRAKIKFDDDPVFKEKSRQGVVHLQGGDPSYTSTWTKICDVSRTSFKAVYKRLNVTNLVEMGESFYHEYIPTVIQMLEAEGLVEDSKGARVIKEPDHPTSDDDDNDHLDHQSNAPLMLVKRDGAFTYDSTDITALWYRLNEEKADVVIYVTDIGQSLHFQKLFDAAIRAGWLSGGDHDQLPFVKHVGFGLVLGEDGRKIRTRSSTSEDERLVDLLDKAKEKSKTKLVEREFIWSDEDLEEAAEALGYGAVKYADLKNNRFSNYVFKCDQILAPEGNTAVYLLYTHARICSVIRKSGKVMREVIEETGGKLQLLHPSERSLGLELIRFGEFVEDAATELVPKVLCDYLYSLAGTFTDFYTNCKVVGSEHEISRLLLCEATALVMRECFNLLGIKPLNRL